MFRLSELIEYFGIETLVQLSNDDPNVDKSNPININTALVNHLLTEMEGRYGHLAAQFPSVKYLVYRLIILELHRRRQEQGALLMEENLQKEYEFIVSQLESFKYIIWRTYDGKGS